MRFLVAFRAAAVLLTAILLAYPVAAQDKGPAKTLAAPTGLWAAQTSPTEITLVWDSVPSARGFKISSKSGVINLVKMTRYVVHITTVFGIPIQYHIEAVGEKGEVSPKAAFPVVTPEKGAVTGALPRPGSVTAKETAPGIIAVTWTAVPEATAYLLGRAVAPEGLKTLCPLCPTKTEYVDNATTAGAKHTYGVQAIGPGGASQRTMSNVVIPTGSPGPDPNPPAGGAEGVPKGPVVAGCTGGERYKTCASNQYEVTAIDLVKTGSAYCPGGYAALGGGYEGSLIGALVQASRPLAGTAKEPPGWTVTVARLIFPASADPAYQISTIAMSTRPIRFAVFVVCGPDS
jgi:hypothetical protein